MRMIEIDYEAQPPIDSYGPGGFRIAGEWHEGAVLLTAAGPTEFGGLNAEGVAPILALSAEIDVLMLGMGPDIAALDRDLRMALDAAGIGFEIMSTPSACRTYNVLLTEDRRVAAALIPV